MAKAPAKEATPQPWAPVPAAEPVTEPVAEVAVPAAEPVAEPAIEAAPEVPATTALEGEVVEMVTATAPKAFKLRIDNHRMLDVKAGVQQMERAHAEHWYAKANGVEIYSAK